MTTQPAPLETDERPAAISIGYPIWWFNTIRRVYEPGGRGGPIWVKHWELVRVTGESPRLWIVNHGAAKFSKALTHGMALPNGLAWTKAEIDRQAWQMAHRYSIAKAVERMDLEGLERIARLIGYEPLP